MGTWLDDQVVGIRQRLSPQDEDSLWVVFFVDPGPAPDGEPATAMAIDGAMAHMDGLMTQNLALIIDSVPASAALLAVPRPDGIPRAVDKQLWRDVEPLLRAGSTELIDLVVVGDSGYWSARADPESRCVA